MSKDSNKNLSKSFGVKWGERIMKFRWPVLIGSIVLFLAAASGGVMKFDSDYHVFFSDDNPQLLAYDALQNTYTKDDNVFIVIERKDGKDLFDAETLTALEEFTEQSWQVPYSSRVDGITNFQYTRAEEDDLYVDDLISGSKSKSGPELAELKEIATTDSRILHRLMNETGTATAVNITVRLPDIDGGEIAEITAYSRNMVKEFEDKHPELKTYMSGFVMMNAAFFESASGDAQTLTPLMFLIVIIEIGT